MREYATLIERGWARPYTAHNDKHKIIYACNESDTVMGGIVYGLNTINKVGWIVFSFTVPEYKRQGVYTALHSELEKRLRDAGMVDLASHVHVDNTVRQASCERVGMMPEFYRMNKKL
jgi:GNAT superfamily N-acetyltransferase